MNLNPALQVILSTVTSAGAPVLASVLGGPAGALASIALTSLAAALGSEATPEGVAKKIEADPAAAAEAIRKVEAAQSAHLEELRAELGDVQDARQMQIAALQAGSPIQWGPIVIAVIVLTGFGIFSYLALNPGKAEREVILYLLGSWQTLAGMAVAYWLGSSQSSNAKNDALAALAQAASRNVSVAPAPAPLARAAGQAAGKAIGRAVRPDVAARG